MGSRRTLSLATHDFRYTAYCRISDGAATGFQIYKHLPIASVIVYEEVGS
jgi:hypothetical protein